MTTLSKKIKISIGSGLLLAFVNNPYSYKLIKYYNDNGCSNSFGRLVISLIFVIVSFISMFRSKLTNMVKLRHSIYGGLIAYFIMSPDFYLTISKVITGNVKNNCLTTQGYIMHVILYILALWGVMYLPK